MAAGRRAAKLVVAPSVAVVMVFIYGFVLWTLYISFTASRILPAYELTGWDAYARLWQTPRWHLALRNLGVFSLLFISVSMVVGVGLAVLLDQRARAEGVLRTLYLYPMALSFVVAGTAWRWILNPGIGIQAFVRHLGFPDFTFDWIARPETAVYALVVVAVWQSTGFVVALFLAALRGVDQEIIRAARLDGAATWQIYWGIVLPSIRPVVMSALVVLLHVAVTSYDLVVALTGGGPGYASDMPATFMVEMAFRRNQINVGAASAIMMLAMVVTIVVPYLYAEMRAARDA